MPYPTFPLPHRAHISNLYTRQFSTSPYDRTPADPSYSYKPSA